MSMYIFWNEKQTGNIQVSKIKEISGQIKNRNKILSIPVLKCWCVKNLLLAKIF